jgi:predicted RNA binding protein YcfA (HicA-like mRNA interferase family)
MKLMPKTANEMERIIRKDGWEYVGADGSRRHYTHPTKPDKVTIPFHGGGLDIKTENSIRRQARLK